MLDDIPGIIDAISKAAPALQIVAIGGFVLWMCMNRLFAFLDNRQQMKREAELEEAKTLRAEAFKTMLGNLVENLKEQSKENTTNLTRVGSTVEAMTHAVMSLHRVVSDVRDRQAKIISRGESLAIVEAKFIDYVRNEALGVFEQSLRRNAYQERKDFVRDRVKTAIGEIITRAHQSLERDYPALSLNLDPFFTERGSGTGGLRYTLCDTMWEKVEPLYLLGRGAKDIDQRVEEMCIILSNIVNDYVTSARETACDIYANCEEDLNETAHGS